MKKILKRSGLLLSITMLLLGSVWGVNYKYIKNYSFAQENLITMTNEDLKLFLKNNKDMSYTRIFDYQETTKSNMNDEFKFELNEYKKILLKVDTYNSIGELQLEIRKDDNTLIFSQNTKTLTRDNYIGIDKGKYKLSVKTGLQGFAKIALEIPNDNDYIKMTTIDLDNDGLSDDLEKILKTNPNIIDTDGDGLSDYMEVYKYKTNPLKNDSDNDRIMDNDWNERREYTYTLKSTVDIKPNANTFNLNDFYKDYKKLKNLEDGFVRYEMIVYPFATKDASVRTLIIKEQEAKN